MDDHDGARPGRLRVDDPWCDPEPEPQTQPLPETPPQPSAHGPTRPHTHSDQDSPHRLRGESWSVEQDRAGVYREVQAGAAFQEVRRRYRGFAFPATAGFLVWYLLYVIAATTAPGLMARPVAGAVNVAMVAGLAQFATTFLLTWAYARHARLRTDRAALELRWDTQERIR